ncbi:unnamed protein product [Sphenostylis stenocarpa]|uniref:Uncharacterized protein n=1 Tax=Sphenostylis stenocarpa TaxID=92480 RepID=A0AA86VRQ7_9FABA|nr:unnamed protein product [Sphenostylis stenocarpa]
MDRNKNGTNRAFPFLAKLEAVLQRERESEGFFGYETKEASRERITLAATGNEPQNDSIDFFDKTQGFHQLFTRLEEKTGKFQQEEKKERKNFNARKKKQIKSSNLLDRDIA